MQKNLTIHAGICRDAMNRVRSSPVLMWGGRDSSRPYSRSIVHPEGYRPRKIAIIGPSGAGKTTLATELSSTLKINAIYLDRLFWQRDWMKKSLDDRIDILERLTQEKQWIIDGTYINSDNLHLIEADTILFLDMHPFVCLYRILKRYREHGGDYRRRDIPEGCADTLTLHRILNTLFFRFQGRIKLEMNLRKFPKDKVIRLHSTKEVERFLTEPETYTGEDRQRSSLSLITIPMLASVIIAILTGSGLAVAISLALTVVGHVPTAWH